MNLGIIIAHCLLHLGCALYFYKKDGLTIQFCLWFLVSFFCIGGVILLFTDLYWNLMEYPHFSKNEHLKIIPYFCNFLFTYLVLQVWRNFNLSSLNIEIIKFNDTHKKIIQLVYAIGVSYIVLKLFQFSVTIKYGMGNMHDFGRDKVDEIFYSGFKPLLLINYLGRLNNVAILPYVVTYFFLGYNKGFFKFKQVCYILLLYASCSILTGLVAGSRGTTLFSLFNVLFFVILFWKWIPTVFQKKFTKFFILFVSLLVMVFSIIGSERFSKTTGFENVLRYWGESYLNFGFEFFNHIDKHTDGMFNFGFIVEKHQGQSLIEMTGTNLWWFQTLYGSLYIDFGLIIPFIFPLLLLGCMRLMFNKRNQITKLIYIPIILYLFNHSYHIPFGFSFTMLDINFLLLTILTSMILDKFFVKNI